MTESGRSGQQRLRISTHVPRAGHDGNIRYTLTPAVQFQPTCPVRGTTRKSFPYRARLPHFNPRAPCGARPRSCEVFHGADPISTHVPRAGHDEPNNGIMLVHQQFQPTRPIRGATWPRRPCTTRIFRFQPTRPIRGATRRMFVLRIDYQISTHAPHTGRDYNLTQVTTSQHHFNPRAPYGARHTNCAKCGQNTSYFNPRAPYGARLSVPGRRLVSISFQPTRPIRGATHGVPQLSELVDISTHAPHTGRDLSSADIKTGGQNFNPRAPYGARRTGQLARKGQSTYFNPRAPYGARRDADISIPCTLTISTHAPHTGRDVQGASMTFAPHYISTHAPHTGRDC